MNIATLVSKMYCPWRGAKCSHPFDWKFVQTRNLRFYKYSDSLNDKLNNDIMCWDLSAYIKKIEKLLKKI